MKYSEKYLTVDMFSDSPKKHIETFLLTKAIDWCYEKEWRIFDHRNGPANKNFPQQSLTGIIFGARVTDEHRAFVIECVKHRQHPIEFLQATISEGSFSLNVESYRP